LLYIFFFLYFYSTSLLVDDGTPNFVVVHGHEPLQFPCLPGTCVIGIGFVIHVTLLASSCESRMGTTGIPKRGGVSFVHWVMSSVVYSGGDVCPVELSKVDVTNRYPYPQDGISLTHSSTWCPTSQRAGGGCSSSMCIVSIELNVSPLSNTTTRGCSWFCCIVVIHHCKKGVVLGIFRIKSGGVPSYTVLRIIRVSIFWQTQCSICDR
jgi:hypothetical protein